MNGEVVHTEITLNDGMWHHVCVTWEGRYGNWQLFVNGSIVASGVDHASGTYIVKGGQLVIGKS